MEKLIFYTKRGPYITADEVRAQIGGHLDDVSITIIKEPYNGKYIIEYNLVPAESRDIANQIISKKKEKEKLMWRRSGIPQYLSDKIIYINACIDKITDELSQLYKIRSDRSNLTKSQLLFNVGNANIKSVITKSQLTGSGVGIPSDFTEKNGVNKYSVLFFNGYKYSFAWNQPILFENPNIQSAGALKLEENIKNRRENMMTILKGKIII